MMKRHILLAAVAVSVLLLAACGKTTEYEHTAENTQEAVISATVETNVDTGASTEDTSAPTPTEASEETTPVDTAVSDTVTPEPTQSPADDGKIVVVLDPGHGGSWVGIKTGKYVEAELNLKISYYTKAYIEEHYPQIEVYMTRTDEKVYSDDLTTDLRARVAYAVEKKADIFVSQHLNYDYYHSTTNYCSVCVPHRASVKEDAARLASYVLDNLEALGIPSMVLTKGVRSGLYYRESDTIVDSEGNPVEYYGICRHTAYANLVGIIIEHCFINNPEEQEKFFTEEGLKSLGEADAKAIGKYFGLE